MKYFFSIILFFPLIVSCNQSTHPDSIPSENSISEIPKVDSTSVKINTFYPFGSQKFDSIKFPHYWAADQEHYGRLKSPEGLELQEISTQLSKIHNANTIKAPIIDSIEYLNLNKNYLIDSYYFDTIAVKSTDSCLYRLPDMGGYECYYFRQHSKKQSYGVYGSLMLLDPITRVGKVLTLYFEYGGEQHVNLRYYLIENETISIYDGSCYDDGTTMKESFQISFKPEKIVVVDVK